MSLWRRLTGFERSDVLSPLGRAACVNRVGETIGGPLSIFGSRAVYGWGLGQSFWLRWRDEVHVIRWLLFASVTRVTFEDAPDGTLVKFRSRPSLFSALTLATIAFIGINVVGFAIVAVFMAAPGVENMLVAALPIGAGLVAVMINLTQHLALDDDPHFEVVKFVSRSIDGALAVRQRRRGRIIA